MSLVALSHKPVSSTLPCYWLVDSLYKNSSGQERLERREVFCDGESARLYASLLAKKSNQYWRFAVFELVLPKDCQADIYKKQ